MARFQALQQRETEETRGREMSVSAADEEFSPLPRDFAGVARSWPSSPLLALSSSPQVTARLYRPQLEVKGHAAGRQVSFALSSPDLTAVRSTAATPPLYSHRPEESQEVDCSLDSSSSRAVIGCKEEEAESEAEGVCEEMKVQSRSEEFISGRKHIQEMENVRTHLQSILRDTQTTAERHEFQHFLDDSHESEDTSHLLSAVSLSGVEDLFPLYSRVQSDSSCCLSDVEVVRERLERERSRRKVCEEQLVFLQSKVLQLQQQVTLAVAADHKKDAMIEQLDKTLVKVVQGWKTHDHNRTEEIRDLQQERETTERQYSTQREALSHVQQNLSQVKETLEKEQKQNQELQKINKRLEQQLSELRVCVEDLQQERERLRREADRQTDEQKKQQTESQNTQTQLQQHIQELEEQLTHTTQQLERERAEVKQVREDTDSRIQQLQQDLDQTRRDRDTLRLDRTMDQARFEAQRSQMEVQFRLSLEQQLNERLTTVQEENNTHTTQLQQQHRKQLVDLSARHERELSAQMNHFRTQLQQKHEQQQHLTQYYQHKLSEVQEELVSMAAAKRRLETQREELVSRLQGMMRSHWAEALRLLTNPEQTESGFSALPLREASRISHPPPDTPRNDRQLAGVPSLSLSTLTDPQAVVLHLSRERDRMMRVETGLRSHSDSSVLNTSYSFTPLDPVLDQSNRTALSDCSVLRSVFSEDRGNCTDRKMKDRNENLNEQTREIPVKQTEHMITSQCEQNPQLNQNLDLNQQRLSHTSTCTRPNHSASSDSGLDRGGASVVIYSSDSEKAPPIGQEAPPSWTTVSSFNKDRQGELQYYISKLLERSPGDPLEEPTREQSRAKAAVTSASPRWERSADDTPDHQHQHLTDTHITQLQQTHTLNRSSECGGNTVRSNVEQKSDEQKEAGVSSRRAVSRVLQSRKSSARGGGSQRVWR